LPTCIRCRRETEAPEGDELALRLDGRPMLEALRELDPELLDDRQREVLDRLAAGLCPACGAAL